MAYRYDTYCGLYCGACPALHATRRGAIAAQAAEWNAVEEEVTCHGCKSDVVSVYCRTCDIKACAVERNIESCVECAEYQCGRLIAFRNDEWPHHSVVTRNLEALRAAGLEAWLEDRAERWRCSSCGADTSWYDEACSTCGAKAYSSRDEEEQEGDSLRKERC